jgi:hypothetical protein
MTEAVFPLAVKSTIDKLLIDFATTLTPALDVVDLDDPVNMAELLASEKPAVVWEMLQLEPLDGSCALYVAVFNIGAKTTNDPSNYGILALVGKLGAVFRPGTSFQIRDYSGALPGAEDLGYMYISGPRVVPQQFDQQSGVRMATVEAKIMRYGG